MRPPNHMKSQENAKSNYYLAYMDTHTVGSENHFSAIFHQTETHNWFLQIDVKSDEMKKDANRKKDAKRLGLALKDRNDYDGCLDCLPKKNRTSGQDKGDCKEQGMCYLYITGKCIACKEFVLEFAIALDMLMASKSGKQ